MTVSVPDRKLSGRPLPVPTGMLLDLGGVIAETTLREGWAHRLAKKVSEGLRRAEVPPDEPSHDRIIADITAGARADSYWKNAMSRPARVSELSADQFWCDFVAGDWPSRARDVVVENAHELCAEMVRLREERTLRQGVRDVLRQAARRGVVVGIVSNTLAGSVYRDFIDGAGLTDQLQVQVYSDEVGVRKPDPAIILEGTNALGVDPGSCWYVGDTFDRDVLCAHRAGIAGNVLMESRSTWRLPYEISQRPDAIVADHRELGELLARAHDAD